MIISCHIWLNSDIIIKIKEWLKVQDIFQRFYGTKDFLVISRTNKVSTNDNAIEN